MWTEFFIKIPIISLDRYLELDIFYERIKSLVVIARQDSEPFKSF